MLNTTLVLNAPAFGPVATQRIFGGWQLSALFQALSGSPLNVTIGRDQALTGWQNQRPNVNGDWELEDPTNAMYFNTSVFSFPAPGTHGNLGRNALRGPARGTWTWVSAAASRSPGRSRSKFAPRLQRLQPRAARCHAADQRFWRRGPSEYHVHEHAVRQDHDSRRPRIMQFALKYHF